MTLEEAGKVTNQPIADYLGGLPEQKMHCSVMGREALEAAIENYKTGGTTKKILEGKVVCNCFGITQEEIERVVRENNLTTVEEVTNYTKAGGGCGQCKPDIEAIIETIRKERESAKTTETDAPRKMTTLQKIKLIQETLDNVIRPLLKRDGGDLELLDIDGDRVLISFRGMCANCNVAQFTMKDVVEAKLREFVSPSIVVEEDKP